MHLHNYIRTLGFYLTMSFWVFVIGIKLV